ncbi:MAG: efflux RND transporter periplasmic adaptor subunit [Planctomycetota bacterium]|jgi:RND family efflux transporter MFP subunit
MIKAILRFLLILVILAAAAAGAVAMVIFKKKPQKKEIKVELPAVRFVVAEEKSVRLHVSSYGTVSPKTEYSVIAEVPGRIVRVSDGLEDGSFFREGEPLARIEKRDYELALVQAEAGVKQAELMFEQEKARASVAEWDLRDIPPEERTELGTRKPQIALANASVLAAKAALEAARRNLARTEITAPFNGRVRRKLVDTGQVVAMGSPIAQIYSTDAAEIRLPVSDTDLGYIDLPMNGRNASGGISVRLEGKFAGKRHTWEGRIARVEGEIDQKTRMLFLVAEVADPFGLSGDGKSPPLAVGMFVRARIEGRRVDSIVELPRSALRGEGSVFVIDGNDILISRKVDILKHEGESVLISGGLEGGERVCISTSTVLTEGTQVETRPE